MTPTNQLREPRQAEPSPTPTWETSSSSQEATSSGRAATNPRIDVTQTNARRKKTRYKKPTVRRDYFHREKSRRYTRWRRRSITGRTRVIHQAKGTKRFNANDAEPKSGMTAAATVTATPSPPRRSPIPRETWLRTTREDRALPNRRTPPRRSFHSRCRAFCQISPLPRGDQPVSGRPTTLQKLENNGLIHPYLRTPRGDPVTVGHRPSRPQSGSP